MKNKTVAVLMLGFLTLYADFVLQHIGAPEALAITETHEVARTTGTISMPVACSSQPVGPVRIDPYIVGGDPTRVSSGTLPGRFSVELWNDDAIMDACIGFSTANFQNVQMNVSVTSSTACRRLVARSAITYTVGSNTPIFCVSSAGYSGSSGGSPLIWITQLK